MVEYRMLVKLSRLLLLEALQVEIEKQQSYLSVMKRVFVLKAIMWKWDEKSRCLYYSFFIIMYMYFYMYMYNNG